MRPFTYSRADTPAAAVQAAVAGGAATRFLAGGTTLYDLMKLNVETPRHVIDVTGLGELTANKYQRVDRSWCSARWRG